MFLLEAGGLCLTLWWRWSPGCGSTSSVHPSLSSDLAGRSPLVGMTGWGQLTPPAAAAAPGPPGDWQHKPPRPEPLLTGYRRIWCPPLSAPGSPAGPGGPGHKVDMVLRMLWITSNLNWSNPFCLHDKSPSAWVQTWLPAPWGGHSFWHPVACADHQSSTGCPLQWKLSDSSAVGEFL